MNIHSPNEQGYIYVAEFGAWPKSFGEGQSIRIWEDRYLQELPGGHVHPEAPHSISNYKSF
jgi:hypothetical protein